MEAFTIPSDKFDNLDFILSNIVNECLQSDHNWIVRPVFKFITACPKVKFPLTMRACSTVTLLINMLTPEQREMIEPDGDERRFPVISMAAMAALHAELMHLMQSCVQTSPVISSMEYVLVQQAIRLSDLCILLARDLCMTYMLLESLEQARQNVIAYRAAVIRGYDEEYPNAKASSFNFPNLKY